MVYLSRIYTKTGDQGETALGDGTRVPKNHPRVAAYGTVDELNSVLGVLLAQIPALPEAGLIRGIQNDLFDVGADLCLPQSASRPSKPPLRVRPEQAERLEKAIDGLNANLVRTWRTGRGLKRAGVPVESLPAREQPRRPVLAASPTIRFVTRMLSRSRSLRLSSVAGVASCN